jgi:DNA-binding Lrp family transcriptional regulator
MSTTRRDRDATLAQVIEAIDRHAPETKTELADVLGLSEHYLSELLAELKSAGVVSKGYVVDRQAVYESTSVTSPIHGTDRDSQQLLEKLSRLDAVTADQYAAARATFTGECPDLSASQLESLANERCLVVLDTLKSFTLTTDWPGNRVAADLSMIATNMELVGDHACFISETASARQFDSAGGIQSRIVDVFDSGTEIHGHLDAILYECELGRIDDLYAAEEEVHRELDELFELVTTYDADLFGHLAAVTRALERAVYYWVSSAELALELLSGLDPDHLGR